MNKNLFQITLISNVVFEPYLRLQLEQNFQQSGKQVWLCTVTCRVGTMLEDFSQLCTANMILVLIKFDEYYPDCHNIRYMYRNSLNDVSHDAYQNCTNLYALIKKYTDAPILWFGFDDYCYKYDIITGNLVIGQGIVDRLNLQLNNLVYAKDTYIDLKHLIAKVGIQNAYNPKGKYRWNAPYSKELIELMGQEIYKQYLIHSGITKKCVVLDCDNVLWGGILSEEGIEKIHLGSGLGQAYQDFQRFLLTLYYHGVLLTVCSKNDEADVLRVFREHSGMILKEEHIACFKVNWSNKPNNIKEIANELEIGLDSMVFIDDSEFEIHSVETMIPEVTTIQYERDSVYEKLSCFNLKSHIDIHQVQKRNQTYRTNVSRRRVQAQSTSYEDYINALEMRIDIHQAIPAELARISELSQRTNKCTNGTRYTVEQLGGRLQTGKYKLYSVYVADKFSDLGLVGAIGIIENQLDLFSLSCRALGRDVEAQMLAFIAQHNIVKFSFASTHKNQIIHNQIREKLALKE